ncbi:MAG: hypothetical protein WBG48_01290 [Pricia sp.]
MIKQIDLKRILLVITMVIGTSIWAQKSEIRMPAGRIAFSSDGNLHDSDDWGATAFSLAMLHYAGLENRLVHYDYNNHLGKSRKSWERTMDTIVSGACKRFGLDASKIFDDQTQKQDAVQNFVREAEKSSAENPLWFICAGPMQVAYEMLKKVPNDKRRFIHAVSHSKWNNEHQHGEAMTMTWADMKADFPEVVYHDITDQNRSNGEDDFQSHIQNWFWLRDSDRQEWRWLFATDDTNQVDKLENWKSDTEKTFDISDAGMTYWLITGGPNGGNEKAGWKEVKALFQNKPIEETKTPDITVRPEDYIIMEAESTKSELGEWTAIRLNEPNYIAGASGWTQLEFQGNNPDQGKPNSPLKYTFTAPKDGNFRLLLMSSKRLEGVRGDMCNDAWVKIEGDFSSACKLTKEQLGEYIKYFQEGSTKTPELEWHWGIRAEKGRHIFYELIYGLRKGKQYTLTLAGRSQRFSLDYMVLYDADKLSLEKAKELFQ